METRIVPTREGYDLWSEIYDGEGNPLVALEEPVVADLLGDVTGLSLLDVGCGTGRHAIACAAAGAHVTAVDFSAGMLARARKKAGAEHITFVEHDLTTPLPFPDATFDRVLSALVVDHIADLGSFFAELARVCRPTGAIVVTVMHPAMMLKGVQARFTDPSTGHEIRPESMAHQTSDYVLAATRTAVLDSMIERAPDAALATAIPRAAKYLGWPLLLAFRLRPRSS